ncbi:HupE/UreJ family protein [Bordetella sp. 2513F-2]
MRYSVFARRAAVATLLALPALALAHPGHDHVAAAGATGASLAAGFLHPLTGLDHLCAMVVLGVWSAMTARRVWLAPLTFALLLLAGALLGRAGLALPAVEPMIAVSLLVLGLLTAARARLPESAGAAVAGLFALFHGHAHGAELPGGAVAWAYIGGFMAATIALHCAGIAGGLGLRRMHAWAARVLGGGVALYGAVLLAG